MLHSRALLPDLLCLKNEGWGKSWSRNSSMGRPCHRLPPGAKGLSLSDLSFLIPLKWDY